MDSESFMDPRLATFLDRVRRRRNRRAWRRVVMAMLGVPTLIIVMTMGFCFYDRANPGRRGFTEKGVTRATTLLDVDAPGQGLRLLN
jgi:hypothetical protein